MEAKKRKAEEKDSLSRYVRLGALRGLCGVGWAEGGARPAPGPGPGRGGEVAHWGGQEAWEWEACTDLRALSMWATARE